MVHMIQANQAIERVNPDPNKGAKKASKMKDSQRISIEAKLQQLKKINIKNKLNFQSFSKNDDFEINWLAGTTKEGFKSANKQSRSV